MKRALAILCVLMLSGCGQSMQKQHKAHENGTTDAWPSGQTARPVPAGTVAQGDAAWRASITDRPKVTAAFLVRGRQRYNIFCSECHGFDGNGRGPIVERGFPYPGSLNSAKARALSAQAIFDDISNGTGIMLSQGAQISPRDRWAIVAYLRALQLSQHAAAAEFPIQTESGR